MDLFHCAYKKLNRVLCVLFSIFVCASFLLFSQSNVVYSETSNLYYKIDTDENILYLRSTPHDGYTKDSYNGLYNSKADRPWNNDASKIFQVRIEFNESDDNSQRILSPTQTDYWFCDMSKLYEIDGLYKLDVSNCTSMKSMFEGCSNLFPRLDSGCPLQFSDFDVSKVLDMSNMFKGCESLKTLDISTWHPYLVTSTSSMFEGCKSLETVDISGFVGRNNTNVSKMFKDCENLKTIDLRNCYWTNADASSAFEGCKNLERIDSGYYVSYQIPSNIDNMFKGCDKLPYNESYENEVEERMTPFIVYWAYTTKDENDKRLLCISESPITSGDANNRTLSSDSKLSGSMKYGLNIDENTGKLYDPDVPAEQLGWEWPQEGKNGLMSSSIVHTVGTVHVTSLTHAFLNAYYISDYDCRFDTSQVTRYDRMFETTYATMTGSMDFMKYFEMYNCKSVNRMFNGCYGITSLDMSDWVFGGEVDATAMFKSANNLEELLYGDENSSYGKFIFIPDQYNENPDSDFFKDCKKLPGYSKNNYSFDDFESISTKDGVTGRKYTVSFNATTGSIDKTITKTYKVGEKVTLDGVPTPTKRWHDFYRWVDIDGKELDDSYQMPEHDVVFYAEYTKHTTYKLTIDYDGGSGWPTYKELEAGYKYSGLDGSLMYETPIKNGFEFIEFRDDIGPDNGNLVNDDTVMESDNTTIFAHWGHKLSLNYNGGIDSEKNTSDVVLREEQSKLNFPILTRDKTEFFQWNTKDDCSGDTLTSLSKMINKDYEAFAFYHNKVSFDANGGTCDTENKYYIVDFKFGDLPIAAYKKPLLAYPLHNYGFNNNFSNSPGLLKGPAPNDIPIFDGWFDQKIGGNKITKDTIVSPDNSYNATLYAQYLYTVYFDASSNGGSCSTESIKMKNGDSYNGKLPSATKFGCTFDGWFTKVSDGNQINDSSTFNDDKNITLYAHFTPINYNVIYHNTCGKYYDDIPTATRTAINDFSLPVIESGELEFLGWNTDKFGNGTFFKKGSSIKKDTYDKNLELYAIWNWNTLQVVSGNLNFDTGKASEDLVLRIGKDSTINQNNFKSISFVKNSKIDESFNISTVDYSLGDGSIILTISKEYLNSLPKGLYPYSIEYQGDVFEGGNKQFNLGVSIKEQNKNGSKSNHIVPNTSVSY